MWNVTINSASVKELKHLSLITKRNVWNDTNFKNKKVAIEFANWCKEIAPLTDIEVKK